MDSLKRSRTTLHNWLPLVLAILFFVLLLALTVSRVFVYGISTQLPLVCAVVFYLLWLMAETRTTTNEVVLAHTTKDRGSLELYCLARGITTLTAISTAAHSAVSFWILSVGFTVFLVGVGLRLFSIKVLGDAYSHRVRTTSQQLIVSSGPYQYVRHPAYTGMLTAHLGFLCITQSPLGFAAFAILLLPAILYRIHVEEVMLSQHIPEYQTYCQGRARLIPYVW